jgi:hypothetical protein
MMTNFTNSRGEYITVGQLAVRTTVYAIGAVAGVVASFWAVVFAFCL